LYTFPAYFINLASVFNFQIIFGSGEHYRAVTATANKHFVSSAYHQGVSFDVILHESRALSEQKELPLNQPS
ncbi:hypothetical protein OESDEN_14719, partial [Oesophagostomum dentatum]